jgi:hypothetical protein
MAERLAPKRYMNGKDYGKALHVLQKAADAGHGKIRAG